MKASFKKRLFAYIIDVIIVSAIFGLLTSLIKDNTNLAKLNQTYNELSEQYINEQITTSVFFDRYSLVLRSIDKENFLKNLLSLVISIGYFIILPFYYNGRTIGKKIMKIKLIKDDGNLSMGDLTLRSIVIENIGCAIVALVLVYVMPDYPYFLATTIFGFIQILLVIISAIMISYRQDKKGLQDLLCNTSVIEEV